MIWARILVPILFFFVQDLVFQYAAEQRSVLRDYLLPSPVEPSWVPASFVGVCSDLRLDLLRIV